MPARFGVEVKNTDCSGEKMAEEFLVENKLEGSQVAQQDRAKKTKADRWHFSTISHAETLSLLEAAFKDNISNKRIGDRENSKLSFFTTACKNKHYVSPKKPHISPAEDADTVSWLQHKKTANAISSY